MSRISIEFTEYKKFELEPLEGPVEGISQRIIARDEKGRTLVRILEYAPGVDTALNGVQSQDYYEEVFIVEGSTIDLRLNQEFTKGCLASRPPKMPHGPWKSPNGCIMYEVNYYVD